MKNFWDQKPQEIFEELGTRASGLTRPEVAERLKRYGPNRLKPKKKTGTLFLLINQFKSPLILLLLGAALLSFFLSGTADASIIIGIVLVSGLLGFVQEKKASNAVEKLLDMVRVTSEVVRDGAIVELQRDDLVPGDIVILNAGDLVPADCYVFEAKDFFVDEATLTGESFASEKGTGMPIFMGTHAVTGQAKAVVVTTGKATEFGHISERLRMHVPETAFETGVRHFGYFLMGVTLCLVAAIFLINVYLARPVLTSFMFALALAVGLTPQLLPAIISINLAHGARRMAQKKMIVKRLSSIENFGSMDVLCADKTGTLTEGVVELKEALDGEGKASEKTLLYGALNATFQTGYANPIDTVLAKVNHGRKEGWEKVDELAYDFERRCLSILVRKGGDALLITKGAFASVLADCTQIEIAGTVASIEPQKQKLQELFEKFGNEGHRVIAVAYRDCDGMTTMTKDSEKELTFLGFLLFFDPLKPDIAETIKKLNKRKVALKIITGDNRIVAMHVAKQLGLSADSVIVGSDPRLIAQVNEKDIFAEVHPDQKQEIILALRKSGHIVGYLGDGINDVAALHAADVGISVDSAADAAKEAADFVLFRKDLSVLLQGIDEGRRTFANTLKYVFMATSANFGNMFSMAGASLFLSFLPLLPKQILLTNLLTDVPEMTIATDRVDHELEAIPQRWDIKFIRRFMITFGLISSIFDYMTFGALIFVLNATPEEFQTGWFVESVLSASMIVLAIRTRQSIFKSRASPYLTAAVFGIMICTALLPYTPLAAIFGFIPLPLYFYAMIAVILGLYLFTVEVAKKIFFKKKSS